MKQQGNMTPPQEHNNSPVAKHKEKEIYEMPEKKVTMSLRKLREIHVIQLDNSMTT